MKSYYLQQLVCLDSIDATLDDMLAIAKFQPMQANSDDIEVQDIQLQCKDILENIYIKMRMLEIL